MLLVQIVVAATKHWYLAAPGYTKLHVPTARVRDRVRRAEDTREGHLYQGFVLWDCQPLLQCVKRVSEWVSQKKNKRKEKLCGVVFALLTNYKTNTTSHAFFRFS